MEVSKMPPADVAATRARTSTLTGQGSSLAAPIAALPDRADIRPLDVSSALQILLAEVRTGLDLPLDAAMLEAPEQAARALLEIFLQGLPEDPRDVPAWSSALLRMEAVIQSGMERAISIVTQWRDVPPAVADAVKEVRAQFASGLDDDPRNPLWLRPEWLGLAPLMQRFRRRRRNARRWLIDPDYPSGNLDEGEGPAR
jgi:hypothetical protein